MFNNCGINKVFLVGHITNDPCWQQTDQQPDMCCFDLTTKENIGKAGRPVEHLEVHKIKIPANTLSLKLSKGQLVHAEGRIQTLSYTDEEQIRRYKTEILVTRLTILSNAQVHAV